MVQTANCTLSRGEGVKKTDEKGDACLQLCMVMIAVAAGRLYQQVERSAGGWQGILDAVFQHAQGQVQRGLVQELKGRQDLPQLLPSPAKDLRDLKGLSTTQQMLVLHSKC